ncbi:MAG: 4-hydroxy-tetrahydrodipicolinate reductase [Candidatus Eisenbacteria bacterium]
MRSTVLVAGICGRMGVRVAELIVDDAELDLVGGIERSDHPSAGSRIHVGGQEVTVYAGFRAEAAPANVLVDFTSAEGTQTAVEFCVRTLASLVVGTTGHSEAGLESLKRAAKEIPLLLSPNMSVGVSLLSRVLPGLLDAVRGECEVEIVEKHHRWKKDSPSGTALKLADALARSRPGEPPFRLAYGRDRGLSERDRGSLYVHSIRAGDVVGEHTVIIGLRGERIEIKHVVESRDCFARGTVAAIKFLAGRPPGWYVMEDVVGPHS